MPDTERNRDADDVRTMTTYKRADGELFGGDYGWIGHEEGCHDEIDGDGAYYLEFIEETWQLVSSRRFALGALERWCDKCDADVTLTEPVDGPVYCPDHSDGPGGGE